MVAIDSAVTPFTGVGEAIENIPPGESSSLFETDPLVYVMVIGAVTAMPSASSVSKVMRIPFTPADGAHARSTS